MDKIYLKLIKFFDIDKVEIRLPICKDFGEMLEKDVSMDKWLNKKVNKVNQVEYIINHLYNNGGNSKQISLLKDYKDQLNVERDVIGK